jgi:hypothetical protein
VTAAQWKQTCSGVLKKADRGTKKEKKDDAEEEEIIL